MNYPFPSPLSYEFMNDSDNSDIVAIVTIMTVVLLWKEKQWEEEKTSRNEETSY